MTADQLAAVTAALDAIDRRAAQSIPAVPRAGRPVPCVLPIDDVVALVRLARAVARIHDPDVDPWWLDTDADGQTSHCKACGAFFIGSLSDCHYDDCPAPEIDAALAALAEREPE